MQEIAVSSPRFSSVPIEDMAPRIAEHFRCWEIVAEHRHHLGAVRPFLGQFLESHPLELQVHAPLSDINISAFSDKVREASLAEVEEAVRLSADLGATCVTFHPGLLSPTSALDAARVLVLAKEAVRRIGRAAEEHSVPVAVENMPNLKWALFKTRAELLECIEGTGVGICFDAGHAHTAGTVEELLDISRLFLNVHLHDNRGERDEHIVLGEGTVPLERVILALKGSYRGNFVIESLDLPQGVRSRDILGKWLAR